MAQYDTVLTVALNQVLVCERQDDGGYDHVALIIYPQAEATVIREDANGDVWVIFAEWPFRNFVFKADELIYMKPGKGVEYET